MAMSKSPPVAVRSPHPGGRRSGHRRRAHLLSFVPPSSGRSRRDVTTVDGCGGAGGRGAPPRWCARAGSGPSSRTASGWRDAEAAALVGGGHETEEELGARVVERREAQVVAEHQIGAQKALDEPPDAVVGETAVERLDERGGGEVAHPEAGLDRGVAEGDQGVATSRCPRDPTRHEVLSRAGSTRATRGSRTSPVGSMTRRRGTRRASCARGSRPPAAWPARWRHRVRPSSASSERAQELLGWPALRPWRWPAPRGRAGARGELEAAEGGLEIGRQRVRPRRSRHAASAPGRRRPAAAPAPPGARSRVACPGLRDGAARPLRRRGWSGRRRPEAVEGERPLQGGHERLAPVGRARARRCAARSRGQARRAEAAAAAQERSARVRRGPGRRARPGYGAASPARGRRAGRR